MASLSSILNILSKLHKPKTVNLKAFFTQKFNI